MSTARLLQRAELVAQRPNHSTADSDTAADADSYRLLSEALAAAFGVTARAVFAADDCPVLQWLHRCAEGTASPADRVLFDRITAVEYFAPTVPTADYLHAMSRLLRSI